MSNQKHPEIIKAMVRMKGKSLSQLATEKGVSVSAVTGALRRPQPKGEKIIAEYLGVTPYELWPDRWTKDGQRIMPRYAYKYIG